MLAIKINEMRRRLTIGNFVIYELREMLFWASGLCLHTYYGVYTNVYVAYAHRDYWI